MVRDSIPDDAFFCRVCWMWINDGIMYSRFKPSAEVTLSDAKEAAKLATTIAAGAMYPLVVDLREAQSLTSDARAFFASDEIGNTTTAVGIFVASQLSRVLGNFFLNFNASQIPTRLFTDRKAAETWARQYFRVAA